MSTIKTYPMQNSSILRIYSDAELIKVSPDYQREGEVWDLEKKQLLLDSILNEYDIPKLYFHLLSREQRKEEGDAYDYAIVDGRQRIETIFSFIDGMFALSKDFEYLADEGVRAGGMTYNDIAVNYPKLKIRFDAYTLPIIIVETDDLELVEDMFSRLNEAVPLNSAEKRNAFGGPMVKTIKDVASTPFFQANVRFGNRRLQHLEVSARLVFLEHCFRNVGRIVDTKKPFLDKMVFDYKEGTYSDASVLGEDVKFILTKMEDIFVKSDPLLRSQSSVAVFYLVMKLALHGNGVNHITRNAIIEFYQKLSENRTKAKEDIANANFELLEFDRMSQQGTNDASSLITRTMLMAEHLGIDYHFNESLAKLFVRQ